MKNVEKTIGDIKFKIDYRIELLGVLMWIGKYHTWMKQFYKKVGNKEYIKEIIETFSPYAKDEIVKEFDSLVKDYDLYYHSPYALFLDLESDFTLINISESIKKSVKDEERLINFASKLKDFAEKTGFDEFFENHRSEYEKYIEEYSKPFEKIDVSNFLFDYYGYKLDKRMSVVLAPFTCEGAFAHRNDIAVYSIIPVYESMKKDKLFVCEEGMEVFPLNSQVHEFSHNFVNPLTSKLELSNNEVVLFPEIKERMEKIGYGSDETIINEHIIRGIEHRFAALTLKNEGFAKGRSDYHKTAGFIYLDFIIEELKDYENKRNLYPTFDLFHPVLVEHLKQHLNIKEK